MALGLEALAHSIENASHSQPGFDGVFLLIRVLFQGPKDGHQSIAHEFVEHAVVFADLIDHLVEIIVQERKDILGSEFLGEAGETTHIGEEDGNLAALALEVGHFSGAYNFIRELAGHVANECSLENIALLQSCGHFIDCKRDLRKFVSRACVQSGVEFAISDCDNGIVQFSQGARQLHRKINGQANR